MIVCRIKLSVKPENKAAFVDYMTNSVQVSRQFEGNVRFEAFSAVDEDNTFLLYEEWANQASFDAFKASEHFQESGVILVPMLATPPDSQYFEAEALPMN